ncbi:MAG: SDR family oxidoreductase [Rhodospirillales bacterium]|mgnify:FL=1|jgi:3-oxoacyl-[acyl-carrier protein] reductase|nr:SDR family oxidoreductase [Rhodospirillales bacterium]MBT4006523.1 SDR family oxidoreductase [Rhodospirillales bacterium]MBT5076758.1 SDR family oxidoreductase [Rhodospirillales bacterium]MBT5113801.1 SDR family oxidoreductase [Rhodospirillales bacterium]MBT5672329.1 SDR family oxidoreductase [Rhodospirillales bacterium]
MGLGLHIAEVFVRNGASVMICARSVETLQKSEEKLRSMAGDGQKVVAVPCDVGREGDIDSLVDKALDHFSHVDILVNNAGVYGPMGAIEAVNWDEWKETFVTNLFGTVYFCRALLPHFKSRGYGKIINISGGGATNALPRITAYGASKVSIVRMTESLAEEVAGNGIDINAIAPGVLDTRLTHQLLENDPETVGAALYDRVQELAGSSGDAMDKSARLCAYLGSAESDGISGKLIAANWDPWPDLAQHKGEIMGSDIYTLRRIVPKDRGQDWGD